MPPCYEQNKLQLDTSRANFLGIANWYHKLKYKYATYAYHLEKLKKKTLCFTHSMLHIPTFSLPLYNPEYKLLKRVISMLHEYNILNWCYYSQYMNTPILSINIYIYFFKINICVKPTYLPPYILTFSFKN